ncbi:MAG: efflux RND transporter periplasmic adaptor subunit [Deltaproteobacteria bacterium]|nr:efflux RND transporter periplasmic adaptor subunit [Deltaproteobacteria bacterium]
MKRSPLLWIAGVLLLLTTLGACRQAPAPLPARAVELIEVQPRDAGALSRFTGSLAPWEQVDLSFAVAGKVQSIAQVQEEGRARPIQEGDAISRSALLATIDDSDYRLKARAAAASIQSAAAQVGAAETSLAQLSTELERARKLRAAGAIAAADLERAESAFAAARSNAEMAKAQRLAASEQHALARSTVEDARIVSPIDGVLARRMVDVGESVGPGMVAFSVIDVSRLRVMFGVPAHRVGEMSLGRKLPVYVEGVTGEAVVGTITKVQPVADPVMRSFSVEISLPNADGLLRPGMVASIAAGKEDSGSALLIPLESVVRSAKSSAGAKDGFAVWVVPPGADAVTQRPLELGDLYGNEVRVHQGLAAGDRVVTRGAQLLREGEKVRVLP